MPKVPQLWHLRPAMSGVLLGAILVALAGAGNLKFDFTPQRVFESDDPRYGELEEVAEVFGRDDNLLVVHVEDPETLFRPEMTDYLRRLREALSRVEGVEGVDDLTSAWVVRPGVGPTKLFYEGADLAEVQQRATQDPLLKGRLVSSDGRKTMIVVRIQPDLMEFDQLQDPVHGCMAALEETERPEGVTVGSTGIPLLRVLIVERLITDQLTFLPVCSVLFIFVLWMMFRDMRAVLVPLLSVFIALIFLTALLGATGEPVNIINNVLPVLVFVIGISDAVHLIVRYRKELSGGRSQRNALNVSIRHLVIACLLTSVTTAVGFASLAAAEMTILKRFGIYAAAGVMMAYVVTVGFVPLAFSYLSPILPRSSVRADGLVDRCSAGLGSFTLRYRWGVLVFGLLLIAGSLFQARDVDSQNDIYEAFSDDDPVIHTNEAIERDFPGILPASIVVRWDEGTDPLDPRINAYLAELQADVDAEQGFSTLSHLDMLREVNHAMSLGFPGTRRLPTTAKNNHLALNLMRDNLKRSGRERVLDRMYAPESRILRIPIWVHRQDSNDLNATFDRIDQRLANDAERQRELGIRCTLSGDAPVASRGIAGLIDDMFWSLILAFAIIFPTMCIMLRSLRAGLVSMIPNMTPLILTLGFMGLLGMDLRLTTVIVFTVSLGLAVDDTIHFMHRFREEWRKERPPPGDRQALDLAYRRALERTYLGTGGAIVMTTVLLSCGFSVLALSQFPLSRTFALCMEITVLGALVGDLIILPAVLIVLKPFKPVRS